MDRADILRRFEEWLDTALLSEPPPQGIPAEILAGEDNSASVAAIAEPPVDLYQMWSAITALTQETRLQGRAFKHLSETLVRDTERRTRKEAMDALLEIRERLLRGLESVKVRQELRPVFWDRIFRARWREVQRSQAVVDALAEGYRLGLRSLDDLLGQFQLRPIDCLGKRFDPRCMNAIDVEHNSPEVDGTVLLVYRIGYEWNGEVYRPAQVRVARSKQGGTANHE